MKAAIIIKYTTHIFDLFSDKFQPDRKKILVGNKIMNCSDYLSLVLNNEHFTWVLFPKYFEEIFP